MSVSARSCSYTPDDRQFSAPSHSKSWLAETAVPGRMINEAPSEQLVCANAVVWL